MTSTEEWIKFIKSDGLRTSHKTILIPHHKTTQWFLTYSVYLNCVVVHANAVADSTVPIVQTPDISAPCGFLQKTLNRLEEEIFHLLSNKPYSILQSILLKWWDIFPFFSVSISTTISKQPPALSFLLSKVYSLLDFCFYLNIGTSMEDKNILENTEDQMESRMTKKTHATFLTTFISVQ